MNEDIEQLEEAADKWGIEPVKLAGNIARFINQWSKQKPLAETAEMIEQETGVEVEPETVLDYLDEYARGLDDIRGPQRQLVEREIGEGVDPEIVEQLEQIGGERWTKYGKDRVYFSDFAPRIDLECEFYKTGNVSSAKLRGEKISNNKASDYLTTLEHGSFWYDLESGEFESKHLSPWMECEIEQSIRGELEGEETD